MDSTKAHSLHISLSDISLIYDQQSNRIQPNDRNQPGDRSPANSQLTLDVIQNNLQAIQTNSEQSTKNNEVFSLPPTQPAPTIRVQTSIQRSCTGLCKCICHRPTTLTSPEWLKGLVGLLFIGYTGSPLLNVYARPCSENLCRKNKNSLLKVNYLFPSWFFPRMISLRDRWNPTDGHLLTVRTPRVVSNTPIWATITSGNLAQLQMLFAQGNASPFDVDPVGTSALIVRAVLFALSFSD